MVDVVVDGPSHQIEQLAPAQPTASDPAASPGSEVLRVGWSSLAPTTSASSASSAASTASTSSKQRRIGGYAFPFDPHFPCLSRKAYVASGAMLENGAPCLESLLSNAICPHTIQRHIRRVAPHVSSCSKVPSISFSPVCNRCSDRPHVRVAIRVPSCGRRKRSCRTGRLSSARNRQGGRVHQAA